MLALLPALLFGSLLDGAIAWIHAHGPAGWHVHVVAEEHSHDVAPRPAWHGLQHAHDHEDSGTEDDERAPEGLQVELPVFVAASSQGSAVPHAVSWALALALPARWHTVSREARSRPRGVRSGWPPQVTGRSGVATLLRSSHAILI